MCKVGCDGPLEVDMDIEVNGMGQAKLPDFFILGTAKGGTSSLFRYLGSHPDLAFPEVKEPWFFSYRHGAEPGADQLAIPGMISDFQQYQDLFNHASAGQLLGDTSPSYLFTHEVTIANLRRFYAEDKALDRLKFIVVLRNPTDRAWSQYWTFARFMREPYPFEEAIEAKTIAKRMALGENPFFDYLAFGRYSSQIKAYQDAFGADKVKIFLFEDLIGDTKAVCRECFNFLGVKPEIPVDTETRYNFSGKPKNESLHRIVLSRNIFRRALGKILSRETKMKFKRFLGRHMLEKTEMPPEIRSRLTDYYREEVEQLEQMLGRDLGSWK